MNDENMQTSRVEVVFVKRGGECKAKPLLHAADSRLSASHLTKKTGKEPLDRQRNMENSRKYSNDNGKVSDTLSIK